MRRCGFLAAEKAGTLEDDFGSKLFPLQLRRVSLRRHRDQMVPDPNRAALDLDGVREMPVHRVPLQKVSEHLGAGEVVDSHDFDVSAFCSDASNAAPNPSKTIDSDLRGHCSFDSLPTATQRN